MQNYLFILVWKTPLLAWAEAFAIRAQLMEILGEIKPVITSMHSEKSTEIFAMIKS